MLSEVPIDWQKSEIGKLFSVVTKGTTPTSVGFSFEESGVPFIKVENISDDGRINIDSMAFISEECHRKLARSVISKNTILYSIAGTIGRTTVYLEEYESNVNQALALMHGLDTSRICQSFIVQYLRSAIVKNIFEAQKTVGAQPNISLKQLKELPVPLPPLNEQNRIAEILSSVDETIASHKANIEQQIRVKRGLMDDLLTGKVRTI